VSGDESRARDRGISVHILGRDYRLACPEGEEKQLLASVDYLNERIKELREGGKLSGNERLAIIAAVNIAHEHLHQRPGKGGASVDGPEHRRRILAMQETLEAALAAGQDKLF